MLQIAHTVHREREMVTTGVMAIVNGIGERALATLVTVINTQLNYVAASLYKVPNYSF